MKDIDPLLNNDENTSKFETNSEYKFLNHNILKKFTVTSNNKRTVTSSSLLLNITINSFSTTEP